MAIARELAKRIVGMQYEDLPAEAVRWAKISFIDTIGCAFAGIDERGPQITQKVLTTGRGAGPSLIWGTARRAMPLDAAAVNGIAAHALDYDDCNNSIAGHPSAALLPAALALGEELGASGRDVILAYVTGFETQGRIAHAVHLHHYEKGWHPTATLGIFGAAAASARLLGLDSDRTATALAIACSLSSGVKANFGTMTKPLHAGECTRNGLYAALLAKEGFTACPEAFEHKHGFFEVFNGAGNYVAGKVLESWADPLEILNPGVGLKQYPCCGSTHSAIDAMLILRERHRLTPGEVAKIESITHDRALAHTDRPDPRSSLDAKFSVQYCVARALMHGDVTFEHFEGETWKCASSCSASRHGLTRTSRTACTSTSRVKSSSRRPTGGGSPPVSTSRCADRRILRRRIGWSRNSGTVRRRRSTRARFPACTRSWRSSRRSATCAG